MQGLPYYVGNVIKQEASMLVATPAMFSKRFNIDVQTGSEVVAINRQKKTVTVRSGGVTTEEPYDALVLATGADALRPPIPGISLPGIIPLRTIPDSRALRATIEGGARDIAVLGAGFIGLEIAENLVGRGVRTSVFEAQPRVMPPMDDEFGVLVEGRMAAHGVRVVSGDAVSEIAESTSSSGARRLLVRTRGGVEVPVDAAVLAMGNSPNTGLARAAGLALSSRGAVVVDGHMRTSDPSIYAVGDAVMSHHLISHSPELIPLAGIANRQGRVAAAAMAGHAGAPMREAAATAVCGVFGLTVAMTGMPEKVLRARGQRNVGAVRLHPGHHAGYYPGAKPISMKLCFDTTDGRILGCQAVGEEGVERRVDVVSMAMQLGGRVQDLAAAELCYAPQFGSAKDPVNIAGMIATNAVEGLTPLADWDPIIAACAGGAGVPRPHVLDVRMLPELSAEGAIEWAQHIPVDDLRERWSEVPRGVPVAVLCRSGQRANVAVRLLRQHGIDAQLLSGGIQTFLMLRGTDVWRAYQPTK
jgi:NADPH-dependent 2,4-dienoyl-CoA reductase/sulfur reductase-like enzyme/rhodanese-related sulfurtransferase